MAPEQTLRQRWNIWAKEKNLCMDCTAMSEEFFLAQFDEMLAEDIEKMKIQKIDIEKYRLDLIKFNRCNKSNRRLNIKEKRAWNDATNGTST